jgi:adenylate kinase
LLYFSKIKEFINVFLKKNLYKELILKSLMKIIFLGPPGSGKGIVSQKIAPTINVIHVSVGELFRKNLKEKSEMGLMAKEFMEKGELAPDDLVMEMVKQRIFQEDCKNGFILDGFPRTIPQAEILNELINIDMVVHMNVSDDVVIARNSARVSCKECGKIYNLRSIPPKKHGICDGCNGDVIRRKDDEPEVMKKRLKIYQEHTQPLVDFYKNKGVLREVFCNTIEQTPDETFQQVMATINKFFEQK